MKLGPHETAKMIRDLEGAPLKAVIDDTCELLTLKLILVIKSKRDGLKRELEGLEAGTADRAHVAAKVNVLGELIVQLSENA